MTSFVSAAALIASLKQLPNQSVCFAMPMYMQKINVAFSIKDDDNIEQTETNVDWTSDDHFNVLNLSSKENNLLSMPISVVHSLVTSLEEVTKNCDATKICVTVEGKLLNSEAISVRPYFVQQPGFWRHTSLADSVSKQHEFVKSIKKMFAELSDRKHEDAERLDVSIVQQLIERNRDFLPATFRLYLINTPSNARFEVFVNTTNVNKAINEKFPDLSLIAGTIDDLHLLCKPAPEHPNVYILPESQIREMMDQFYSLQSALKRMQLK